MPDCYRSIWIWKSYLQSLAAFLGHNTERVPLVADLLTASVYTGGVVIVQLTVVQTHNIIMCITTVQLRFTVNAPLHPAVTLSLCPVNVFENLTLQGLKLLNSDRQVLIAATQPCPLSVLN